MSDFVSVGYAFGPRLAIYSLYATLLTVTCVVWFIRKRRSSILKSQRPARSPFSELEFNVATSKTGVAEFGTNEATTTKMNFCEEHNKSLESSNNDSEANASRQPVGYLGKRTFDQQFQEVEAVELMSGFANKSLNVNFSQQPICLECTEGKLTAPNNKFELSAFTEQNKLFGNDFTAPSFVNDDFPSYLGNMRNSKYENSFYNGIQEIKSNEDEISDTLQLSRVFIIYIYSKYNKPTRKTIRDNTKNISITQGVPTNIICQAAVISQDSNPTKSKSTIFDNSSNDISMTKVVPVKLLSNSGSSFVLCHTVVYEDDIANISITQAVPSNILVNENPDFNKKETFESDDDNKSVPQTLSSNTLDKRPSTRKTIVFYDDNSCNVSFTQGIPSNIMLSHKIYENDTDMNDHDMSTTMAISKVPSLRETEKGNISMTKPIPAELITLATELSNKLKDKLSDLTEPDQIVSRQSDVIVLQSSITADSDMEKGTKLKDISYKQLPMHHLDENLEAVDQLQKKLAELQSAVSQNRSNRFYDKASLGLEEVAEMKEYDKPIQQRYSYKNANNDTQELLNMLTNLTDNIDSDNNILPVVIKTKGSEITEHKRLSFAPSRQSIVLSRTDLLSNISMVQAATADIADKSGRASNDVVKTLQFNEESIREDSPAEFSPLKKTTFGETSYMHEPKGKVIPTYLKDISDGIKELVLDLVKPIYNENLPFDTGIDNCVPMIASTQSIQIQVNLIASSQVDLDPDLCFNPESNLLKFSDLNSKEKWSHSHTPEDHHSESAVLIFNELNPLNNVLLRPTHTEVHKYNPIAKSEETLRGFKAACKFPRTHSHGVHFDHTSRDDNSPDFEVQTVTTKKQKVPTRSTTSQKDAVHKRTPRVHKSMPTLTTQEKVCFTNTQRKVLPRLMPKEFKDKKKDPKRNKSLNVKFKTSRPVSLDQSVDTVLTKLRDGEVNTIIAMKRNKELLQTSYSLTLVGDAIERQTNPEVLPDKDFSNQKIRVSRSHLVTIKEEAMELDSKTIISEISLKDYYGQHSNAHVLKGKKRIYSPVKDKQRHQSSVKITRKPIVKMQKISNSPKVQIKVPIELSSPNYSSTNRMEPERDKNRNSGRRTHLKDKLSDLTEPATVSRQSDVIVLQNSKINRKFMLQSSLSEQAELRKIEDIYNDIFKESSNMTMKSKTFVESKGKVIPTYLKDVSDGIKELMLDLVKPINNENLPFDTGIDNCVPMIASTQSIQIQANLIASSQIDLDPDVCSDPKSSSSIAYKSQFSRNLLKFSDMNSKEKWLLSHTPEDHHSASAVLIFNELNPLNNVLLRPTHTEVHKYNPIAKSEETLRGFQAACKLPRTHSLDVHFDHTSGYDNSPDFKVQTVTTKKQKVSTRSTTSQKDAVHKRTPRVHKPTPTTQKKVCVTNTQRKISPRSMPKEFKDKKKDPKRNESLNVKYKTSRPVSLDQSVDAVLTNLRDGEVNTTIAMKRNKELLETSPSLTLLGDALERQSSPKVLPDKEFSNQRIRYSRSHPVRKEVEAVDLDNITKISEIFLQHHHIPHSNAHISKGKNNMEPERDENKNSDRSTHSPKSRNKKLPKSKTTKSGQTISIRQLITDCFSFDTGFQRINDSKEKKLLNDINTKSETFAELVDMLFTSSMDLKSMKDVVSTDNMDFQSTHQSKMEVLLSQVDWHPKLMYVASLSQCDSDSGVNVVAKIDMLPFMGSHECEWESSSSVDTWSFRLLHGRLRLKVRLGHSLYNATRTRVRGDTPVLDITVDAVQHERKNPVATMCVRFACETMRHMVARELRAKCYARNIPPLLRRCAAVVRVALRWGRAMHDAKLRLKYTMDNDGNLTLKVANIPLRSVWEVTMLIKLVLDEKHSEPCPRATSVRVLPVVTDVLVPDADVQRALTHTPKDWGHVPRTIWRVFRLLKDKKRDDDLLLA